MCRAEVWRKEKGGIRAIFGDILGLYWGYIRVILGIYGGHIGVILGLYLGLYWGYIGAI